MKKQNVVKETEVDLFYEEALDYLKNFGEVEEETIDLELDKPMIKIISGTEELSYDYDNFLNLFDKEGLDAFAC